MTTTTLPPEMTTQPHQFFPGSFVQKIVWSLRRSLPEFNVVDRPLVPTDPGYTISVWAMNWVPVPNTILIGGVPEPTLAVYNIRVQNLIKAFQAADGLAMFTLHAKMIRSILYRDPDLRLQLLSLSEVVMSSTERVMKYGIARQDFIQAQLPDAFTFLCNTDFTVETETTSG